MSESSSPSRMSVHLPVGLLSAAIAIFIASQIGAANRGRETMHWQLDNLDKQLAQIKDAKKQYAEALPERDKIVEQSKQLQQQYTALLTDVLELSKTDADAAKIVEKWKIQPAKGAAEGDKKAEEKKPEETKPDGK